MIAPRCDYCKAELNDYGALLFSPPDKENKTLKIHICKKCYEEIKPTNETN